MRSPGPNSSSSHLRWQADLGLPGGLILLSLIALIASLSLFLNVCRIKLGMDVPARHKLARKLIAGCNVVALEP
jgi:hypothetical protein